MISLIINLIMFFMDFFCFVDNTNIIIAIEEEQKDLILNNFSMFLRKELKKEIDEEIENNDFLKNFNDKFNN